ncbi:MAG TPA: OmpA family protein [Rhizomicrobium sp.]|nr:OmpA family protein [Rhizomicrobium sp.]
MTKHSARPLAVAVALTLGLATSGCQTMSDLDPTGLFGSDETPAPDTQFPTDSAQQAQADANTTTPDLASIPARPPAPDTAAQANAAQQVTAAGTQAQYSADALRAGTEAAAPAPQPADAGATKQALASAAPPPSQTALDAPPTTNDDVPPTAGSAPAGGNAAPTASQPAVASNAPPPPSAQTPTQTPTQAPVQAPAPEPAPPPAATASAAPPPSAQAPTPAASPVAVASAAPPPAQVQSAPIAPPPGAEPAVPAVPPSSGANTAMINPSDAQLGFKPSAAPPLNPSISQWVSPPILARYRQTASLAGTAGTGTPAVPAVPAGRSAGGDVVANLDAVPGTPAGMAAAMNGGVAPTAIIYFPGDGTALSASARRQVSQAVAAFKATGGAASVRVVGHASSRTANMSVERHLEVIFQKSQARASAVAQALIKAGIPADKVRIEAVGDSQPVYYESMPKGEEGNRRAEIFVQG